MGVLMKVQSLALVSAFALATTMPTSAQADAKDALIGGIIGGVIGGAIQKDRQNKKATTKKVVRRAAPTTPSLNGQYSRSERIQIQTSLRDQGYPIGVVDGVLGKNSRSAIRTFQGSIGEPQTGQLTPAQFARLTGLGGNQFAQPQNVNRPLSPTEVAMMQQSLQRLGFYRGVVDGIDGPGTRNAAASFLANQGLAPASMTNVQTLVMASSRAGFVAPQYLVQEASAAPAFGAQPQQQPFGTPQTQQAFGTQPQQQPFGAPQTQSAFGTQPQQQPFGTQQTQPVFGQQQAPGTVVPQQGGQQNPFAVQPAQPMPQQQPQAGQATPLFASGSPAGQPQGNAAQQPLFPQGAQALQATTQAQPQSQSTLDVFAPNATTASAPVQQ